MGSNPHGGDLFSCTIHLDQSIDAKIECKLTWHCCICCNPAKGRVDFEDEWLLKSSFITKDEMKACQLTKTKLPQKKIYIYILIKHINNYNKTYLSQSCFGESHGLVVKADGSRSRGRGFEPCHRILDGCKRC